MDTEKIATQIATVRSLIKDVADQTTDKNTARELIQINHHLLLVINEIDQQDADEQSLYSGPRLKW